MCCAPVSRRLPGFVLCAICLRVATNWRMVMATLTKADLERIIDEQTAEIEKLKAGVGGADGEALAAKDKEIEGLRAEIARVQAGWDEALGVQTKQDDELKELRAAVEASKGADKREADERERADKAERALSEQREELSQLRHDNGVLRGKVERATAAASTLHGHVDNLKAPY